MASGSAQGAKLLRGWRKPKLFDKGIGAELPEAYKKFWKEWKQTTPHAVHYIPKEEKWERNFVTGEIKPIQNIPIPIIYPKEHNDALWGGEGVVKGFQKRNPYKRRVPHFWVPILKRSVVYSEVLDKYMVTIVTDRTLHLIHSHFGLDHYLLKTLACDLKSELALKLKRQILKALEEKCPAYDEKPELQEEVYNRYKAYLASYTSEEIDWYGLSYANACRKLRTAQTKAYKPEPLKHTYRAQLIEKLKAAGVQEAGGTLTKDDSQVDATSWLSKMNPFAKKET